MISLTRLLGGSAGCFEIPAPEAGSDRSPAPSVFWSATARCNLECRRCFVDASPRDFPGELTTAEVREMIDDLGRFGVRSLIIGGGEPLLRSDLFESIGEAPAQGVTEISVATNGTLLDATMAGRLAAAGVSDVAISIYGSEESHDRFRQSAGSWRRAIQGLRSAQDAGLRAGISFTISADTVEDLPEVLRLAEEESISRLDINHLVYSGAGTYLGSIALEPLETRETMRRLLAQVDEWILEGREIEVRTSGNDADGPFVYHWLRERDWSRVEPALEAIRIHRGNSSGLSVGAIDSFGLVYPDPFSRDHLLGSIRIAPFSRIWTDPENQKLTHLRRRHELLGRHCRDCGWLSVCNGNHRARAEAATGDFWATDPGCYLLPEEIAV